MILIIDTNIERSKTLKGIVLKLRKDLSIKTVSHVNGKSNPPSNNQEVDYEFESLLTNIKIVFIHTSNSHCKYFVNKMLLAKNDVFVIGYSGSGSDTTDITPNEKYFFINAEITNQNFENYIADPFLKDDNFSIENIVKTSLDTHRKEFEAIEKNLFKNLTEDNFEKLNKILVVNYNSPTSKIY